MNKLFQLIAKKNLQFEVQPLNLSFLQAIYTLLLIPAFYSELLDYAFYRYFTKVQSFHYIYPIQTLPTLLLIILSFIKVDKDEDHYSLLSVVGLTASYIGEFFWMFEDHITFTVGIIQFFIANLFIALGAIINMIKEKSSSAKPPLSIQNMLAVTLLIIFIGYSMANLMVFLCLFIYIQGILKRNVAYPRKLWLLWGTFVNGHLLTLEIQQSMQEKLWQHYNIVIMYLLDQGIFGAVMYFIGDILFVLMRIHQIKNWVLTMFYISFHYYGHYFIMKGVFTHMDWYFERNAKRFKIQKDRDLQRWREQYKKEQEKERIAKEKKLQKEQEKKEKDEQKRLEKEMKKQQKSPQKVKPEEKQILIKREAEEK